MRPGRLNLTVGVWRDTGATIDEFGAHVDGWTQLDTRRAHIAAAKGTDRFADNNERPVQVVTITLRYDTLTRTLTALDRLRYEQDTVVHEYAIRDVIDLDGLHRWVMVNAVVRAQAVARLP